MGPESNLSPIRTLADISRVHAKSSPERRALAFEDRVTTYGELDALTNQVAQALIASGLKPGDRIAHLGKNTDLYFELLLGAAKAGVVMTPVNWRLAPAEARYIIEDSEARLLFVGPEFIDAVAAYTPHGARPMSSAWRRPFGVGRTASGVMRSGRVIRSWPFRRMLRPSSSTRRARQVIPRAPCWRMAISRRCLRHRTLPWSVWERRRREPRRDAVLSHWRHGLGDHGTPSRCAERRDARVRSGQSARLH